MKVVKVTEEYFELEDGSIINHVEPLQVIPTLEEFQNIYDLSERFVKGE
jgi:hypothetical protein